MAKGVRVEIKDTGMKKFLAAVKRAGNTKLKVGIMVKDGAKKYDPEPLPKNSKRKRKKNRRKTVLEVAEIHEFGRGLPKRSFVRSYIDREQETLKSDAVKIFEASEPTDAGIIQAFERLGLRVKSGMQRNIQDNQIKPPTLPRKGEGKKTTLIDTGLLVNSITYEVSGDLKAKVDKALRGERKKLRAQIRSQRATRLATQRRNRKLKKAARFVEKQSKAVVKTAKRFKTSIKAGVREYKRIKRAQVAVKKAAERQQKKDHAFIERLSKPTKSRARKKK